jgi:hypothetical protein
VLTQHLGYTTNGLTPELRLFQYIDNHNFTGLGSAFIAGRDKYIDADPTIFRFNPTNAAIVEITTDHFLSVVFKHFGDDGFYSAAMICAALADKYDVTIETAAHLAMIEYVILATPVMNQKTKAIGMALHPTLDQIHFIDQAKGALARAQQLAIADHGNQPAAQCFYIALIIGQAQLIAQLRVCCGALAFFQVLQYEFPTGNGVFVFLSFPFKIRVSGFPSADRS